VVGGLGSGLTASTASPAAADVSKDC
jgi:hypothetical protein